jgi:hypothetical protein
MDDLTDDEFAYLIETQLANQPTAMDSIAVSLSRIADSLAAIAACADGIHPSAFRISNQG